MTLNITILTPAVIYQSGDYMLSNPATGKAELMPSTKAVGIRYPDWTGFLTYTGIGRVGTRYTADFVTEWLRGQDGLSFQQAVELIRQRASAWLAKVSPGARQTFVLAAFVQNDPVAAIISNFQRWHGADEASVAPELFTTEVRPKRKTEVIVTGVRAAVARQQRRDLQRLADKWDNEPLRVRAAMSEVTRRAARAFPNLISEDSFVQSLDQHGRGQQSAAGRTRAAPQSLSDGIDLFKEIRPLLDQQFGKNQWSMVGGTSATSEDRSTSPPSCELRVANSNVRRDYVLSTLSLPQGNRAQPRGINLGGEIVGEGSPRWRGPSYPCLWQSSGELVFLPHLGGLGGSASGVTDTSMIVGHTEMPNRQSHACKWLPSRQLVDLGLGFPSHSGVRGVNSIGDIVGWSSVHPTDGGQAHFRPTVWPVNGEPSVLSDLGGKWGEAIDINEEGLILLMTHDFRHARAALWRGQEVVELGPPTADCVSFLPTKLTPTGSVLGTTQDAQHRRRTAVRYADGRWAYVPLPAGAHTTCGTDDVLVGGMPIDGGELPWIWAPGDPEPTYLPFYLNHYNRPTAIGSDGRIIGTASGDYCSHAVVWTPC